MRSEIFWTKEKHPGRIALVPRPRGGDWLEDEAAAWAFGGLNVIVSMLDAEEIAGFELKREAEFCAANGIEFVSFPVKDRGVPDLNEEFQRLTEKLKTLLLNGKNIGIHCRQSIGRAPVLAAILMTKFGVDADEAFRELSRVRGVEVPETDEQRKWVKQFAEESAAVAV